MPRILRKDKKQGRERKIGTNYYVLCLIAIEDQGISSAQKKLKADFPRTSEGR